MKKPKAKTKPIGPLFPSDEITVSAATLKDEINSIPDDAKVFFGTDGDLTFFRVKKRGPKLYQIEFNEQWEITSGRPQ